ncbi:MAG: hypothetical protein RL459_1055, partial [Pseudomonadota bacterium]
MVTTQALRERYRADKALVLQGIASSGASTRGMRNGLQKISELADDVLRKLWLQCGFGKECSLAAVGGFGRAELFPQSDVDVLLLLPDEITLDADPALRGRIEAFISQCWDAGLEIGSSVRTVSDCLAEAAKDVTVQTALLEARLITGNVALFDDFQQRFQVAIDA